MNDERLKQLMGQARSGQPPVVPEGFDARVLAAVRREQRLEPVSLWEQLGELFPRLAVGTALVVCACALADYFYTESQGPSLTENMAQLSEHWADTGGNDLP